MRSNVLLRSLLYVLSGMLAAQAGFAFGQEDEEAAAVGERETVIYAARGVPVSELAQSLQALAAQDDVLIVSEPLTNHLILSGAPGSVQALAAVLEQIDRLPRQIEVRLLLVDVRDADVTFADGAFEDYMAQLNTLQADGAATIVNRVRLTTLENQPAQVQIGATKPTTSGAVLGPNGRRNNTYIMSDEGTQIEAVPRASGDGTIVMELRVEQTRIADAAQPSGDDATDITPSSRSTAVLSTTVSVQNGETVTLTDMAEKDGDSSRNLVVIVTARVIE